ncbi:hypothetical protein ALC57_17468 [Trachymyrmex cornetzi]|uniref:Reverse transcriptase domain-containing protein n=1 Tax=Trachymyrmex cornetzi TaxID=471704 RepID=A0A151ITH8_9HYME|nr:hypothetical protein ALC57_17468 [Trachymyrmex cornetzi]
MSSSSSNSSGSSSETENTEQSVTNIQYTESLDETLGIVENLGTNSLVSVSNSDLKSRLGLVSVSTPIPRPVSYEKICKNIRNESIHILRSINHCSEINSNNNILYEGAKEVKRFILDKNKNNFGHVKNSVEIVKKLNGMPMKDNFSIISFDVVSMYTNIPIDLVKKKIFVVPYVNNLSENFKKIAHNNGFIITYKPMNKLNRFIKTGKDILNKDEQCELVYKINYLNCDSSYVGMPKRKRTRGKRGGWRTHIKELQRELLISGDFDPSRHWKEDAGDANKPFVNNTETTRDIADSPHDTGKNVASKTRSTAGPPPRTKPPPSPPYVAPTRKATRPIIITSKPRVISNTACTLNIKIL